MPKLKYIIDNAITPELRQLRGKTLECVSLIGLAVGHDKVREYNKLKMIYLDEIVYLLMICVVYSLLKTLEM